jgi:hypothetical protein
MRHRIDNVGRCELPARRIFRIRQFISPFPGIAHVRIERNCSHEAALVIVDASPLSRAADALISPTRMRGARPRDLIGRSARRRHGRSNRVCRCPRSPDPERHASSLPRKPPIPSPQRLSHIKKRPRSSLGFARRPSRDSRGPAGSPKNSFDLVRGTRTSWCVLRAAIVFLGDHLGIPMPGQQCFRSHDPGHLP